MLKLVVHKKKVLGFKRLRLCRHVLLPKADVYVQNTYSMDRLDTWIGR